MTMPPTSPRVIMGLALVGLVVLFLLFGPRACDAYRSQKAQSRVDGAQSEAATNSAVDSISTISTRATEDSESEALTRENEEDIRAAEGADVKVPPATDLAGRRALCKRDAYKDNMALCRSYERRTR